LAPHGPLIKGQLWPRGHSWRRALGANPLRALAGPLLKCYLGNAWMNLCHDIIYNSIKLPIYFKNLLKIQQNRNGIMISVKFRKSNYGDKMSNNIMQQLWNNLDMTTRSIQDKLHFNEVINKKINK
jgi:hypothetical protein